MKKSMIVVSGLVMVAGMGLAVVSFAQGMGGMGKSAESRAGMYDRMSGMRPMGEKIKHGKSQSQMVALSDGGIVVLTGKTLVKYDKNLNVVKEVKMESAAEEMLMPMPEMGGMKEDSMSQNCPMMKKGAQPVAETVKEQPAAVKK